MHAACLQLKLQAARHVYLCVYIYLHMYISMCVNMSISAYTCYLSAVGATSCVTCGSVVIYISAYVYICTCIHVVYMYAYTRIYLRRHATCPHIDMSRNVHALCIYK